MNLPVIARFKASGVPQTGLSPTVSVHRINQNDGAVTEDLVAGAMTELSDGLYLHNFAAFNPLYNYVFTMDARADSVGLTFTHNLGLTQSDVESGKYTFRMNGFAGSFSQVYYNGCAEPGNWNRRMIWAATTATNTVYCYWQANTLSVFSPAALTNSRLTIIQEFE